MLTINISILSVINNLAKWPVSPHIEAICNKASLNVNSLMQDYVMVVSKNMVDVLTFW